MSKINLPKVSFVICTLNCKDYAERCFKSIRMQDYPQDKVEIVVVDSYSTDGTIEVAKKYECNLILTKVRGYMEGKGMPKAIGCEKAKGEIVITIDSDNALVEKDWLRKMIYPLLNDESIDYAICRQAVVKSDPLVNQYLSYVGTDPFAIYTSLDPQITLKNVNLVDKKNYFVYNNKSKSFLITGGYYLAFRKSTLNKIGGYTRDVDVAFQLASRKGGANIAIVKEAHLHHLITKSTSDFLRKKVKWGLHYFKAGNQQREFKWHSGLAGSSKFLLNVIKNLLILPAIFTTIRMLIIYKDKAWLLHAPLTFGTTVSYLIAFLKFNLSKHKLLGAS